jgi:quercetin dioxygenase-like cupin family protein
MRHVSHESNATESLWSLGCLFVLKARTEDLEVMESLVPPGYSPPLHRHDVVTESFYVLSGRVRFVVGDSDEEYAPGAFVHVPRSVPHSFEVLGSEPARMLMIVVPAGQWDFFTEVGQPAAAPGLPDTLQIPVDLADVLLRHRGAVLGPPLNVGAAR